MKNQLWIGNYQWYNQFISIYEIIVNYVNNNNMDERKIVRTLIIVIFFLLVIYSLARLGAGLDLGLGPYLNN